MIRLVVGAYIVTSGLVCGCGAAEGTKGSMSAGQGEVLESRPALCSPAWEAEVERQVGVSDAEGHGPDLGSSEWRSAVEFRLGVRDQADFPEPGTPAWCERVDSLVEAKRAD